MSLDAIGISGTGMNLDQTWMDAISDNLANVNDETSANAPAFQERFVEASANAGTNGVTTGAALGSAAGQLAYDPSNPLANAQGYVKQPTIDLSDQMTDLIEAQRSYQANSEAITSAKAMYQSALQIGDK